MVTRLRNSQSGEQWDPDLIPWPVRAACDEVLANFRRRAPGTVSLVQIHRWHVAATALGKKAAGIIANWAYEKFERAAKARDSATFRMLIEQEMEPIAVSSKYRFRPLHAAVQTGFRKGVSLLLDAGANIDAENIHRWRPLHLALSNRRKTMAV